MAANAYWIQFFNSLIRVEIFDRFIGLIISKARGVFSIIKNKLPQMKTLFLGHFSVIFDSKTVIIKIVSLKDVHWDRIWPDKES